MKKAKRCAHHRQVELDRHGACVACEQHEALTGLERELIDLRNAVKDSARAALRWVRLIEGQL